MIEQRNLMQNFRQKIIDVPQEPGVYLYKNSRGKVIYVGKANSLRNRMKSYFQRSKNTDIKLDQLKLDIANFEFVVVDNEMEALALENNLIKQYKPKYNILLRDDKTYPCIKLTINETFPRIYVTRKIKQDGALYFGPFSPSNLASRTFKLISRHFQIRTCSINIDGKRPRVCLDYHIKRCMGPCVSSTCSQQEYESRVQDLKLFMEGKQSDLLQSLRKKMIQASKEERFEMAAHLRDTIQTINQLSKPQRISSSQSINIDLFALHQEETKAAVQLFHLRKGRIVDRQEYFWDDLRIGTTSSDIFSSLLKQYYLNSRFIPDQVLVTSSFEDQETLEHFLSTQKKHKVKVKVPLRGHKKKLINLVQKNSKLSFDQRFRTINPPAQMIKQALAELMDLATFPRKIEAFDISNIQGTDSVASMVVWKDGQMKKNEYRKFIIKTVSGIDDFKSMVEVITRRYSRLIKENHSLPDLILVDGGLGQLNAAASTLDALDLTTQPLASIAKKEELIYVRGNQKEPIRLEKHSPVLRLIQKIRDESHRFALSFHRQRRSTRMLSSHLIKITGVGDKTAKLLLQRLGSVRRISSASLDQLTQVVPQKIAKNVYDHFHNKN